MRTDDKLRLEVQTPVPAGLATPGTDNNRMSNREAFKMVFRKVVSGSNRLTFSRQAGSVKRRLAQANDSST